MCAPLGAHIFDYGGTGSADQMQTTYDKIVQYVGSIHGPDITNELRNRTRVSIPEPKYEQSTLDAQAHAETRRAQQESRLSQARQHTLTALEAMVAPPDPDVDAVIKLANLRTEIEEAAIKSVIPLPIKLEGTERTKFENAWKSNSVRNSKLEVQRGLAYSIIEGQCTNILLDKMKQAPEWTITSQSMDPLLLMSLIEKTVLAQTQDQYPYATICSQLRQIFEFQQNTMTNNEFYDRLNTKVDVAEAIGAEFNHKALQEFEASEKNPNVELKDMTPDDQNKMKEVAHEALLSYLMLLNSGKQHDKLRMDLKNDFTTGNNRYPKTRQQVLHLLDRYTKSTVVKPGVSEGASFAQHSFAQQQDQSKRPYDTVYWKDKECYNCGKLGHPANHCRSKPSGNAKPKGKDTKGKKGGQDDKSVSSKTSTADSIKNLSKQMSGMKKTFVNIQESIKEIGEETLTEDEDEEARSFFQVPLYVKSSDDEDDDDGPPPLMPHSQIAMYESNSYSDDDVPELFREVYDGPPALMTHSQIAMYESDSSSDDEDEDVPALATSRLANEEESDNELDTPLMYSGLVAMYQDDSDSDDDEPPPLLNRNFAGYNDSSSDEEEDDPEDDDDGGDDDTVPQLIAGVGAGNGASFNQFETGQFNPIVSELLFKQGHRYKEFIKDGIQLDQVVLLDNQSTMDLYGNKDFLCDIRKSKKMVLSSNGGTMTVDHHATLEGYGDVWYSPDAITNILSFKHVIRQYRVEYDSAKSETFYVHREHEGKPTMEFIMHPSGLHYWDPRTTKNSMIFLQTAEGNKMGFTKKQIKGAESARSLYAKLAYPSIEGFRWAVQSNTIQDCPVTVQNVDDAHVIWGKNIAALKGKTTRKATTHVSSDVIKIPKELKELHKDVTMTADIFYENRIPFFITHSRRIENTTVTHLVDTTVASIMSAWKPIQDYYIRSGFQVKTLNADGEFAPLQEKIQALPGGPKVNITSANEHVPEIERKIRTVKERVRAVRHGLPYKNVPKMLTISIVLYCVKLLNLFPAKGGISDALSPKTIMTGETLSFKKHLQLQIGTYCQVHEEDTPRNSQLPRTKGAICLGPSGNVQGGYKFMSLNSGKKITRRSWDEIPMPDTVIDRVNELGKDQPEYFVFTNRKGRRIGDVEIPGVEGAEIEAPQEIELENPVYENLEAPPPQEAQEQDPIVPVPFEPGVDPVEAPEAPAHEDAIPDMGYDYPGAEGPDEIPGVRKSTRVRVPTKPQYEPSMTGKSYAFAQSLYSTRIMVYSSRMHTCSSTGKSMKMKQVWWKQSSHNSLSRLE